MIVFLLLKLISNTDFPSEDDRQVNIATGMVVCVYGIIIVSICFALYTLVVLLVQSCIKLVKNSSRTQATTIPEKIPANSSTSNLMVNVPMPKPSLQESAPIDDVLLYVPSPIDSSQAEINRPPTILQHPLRSNNIAVRGISEDNQPRENNQDRAPQRVTQNPSRPRPKRLRTAQQN